MGTETAGARSEGDSLKAYLLKLAGDAVRAAGEKVLSEEFKWRLKRWLERKGL